MKHYQRWLAIGLAALLIGCVAAWYATRQIRANQTPAKPVAATNQAPPVDERLLQVANQLNAQADVPDEQALSREAVQLADHELDQAFASALREAAQSRPPTSGPLKQLSDTVAQWNTQIAVDQDRIAALTKRAASNNAAADQLELAKAQLALDQDELMDAQQDLARQGGDQHAKLERSLQEHETAQQAAQPQKTPTPPPTGTLAEQVRAWIALEDRKREVDDAKKQAAVHAANLGKEHDALEALFTHKPVPSAATPPAASNDDSDASDSADADQEDTATMIARLQHLSDQKKSLADLDQRIQDSQQLAETYTKWGAVLDTRERGVLHLLLSSFAVVLAILLATVLVDGLVRRAFESYSQPRRVHHMRLMATLAVDLIAVFLIVLVIFGPPSQLSTIIGLATAGLTVALRDFIVAFFGWFALMGRNGIRVGDWVEIRGVSGEVVEIGILKTVVLEMGDWGSTGLPTGRKVAFVNSFAIEGHYFNFSTAGQWLWDELQVSLPATADPYRLSQRIRELVERATEKDAHEAEQDWQRVTHDESVRPFSAKPLVDLRPSVNGLDVIVRYITHAPQRYAVKSHLFEAIVELLHKSGSAEEPARQATSPA